MHATQIYGRALVPVKVTVALLLVNLIHTTGCYVPLRSPAICSRSLPVEFRTPMRSDSSRLNLANLTVPTPTDYILGPNDVLEVTVPGLSDPTRGENVRPIRTRIMADGTVRLPLVNQVKVGGVNLSQAQEAINAAYANGIIVSPKASVSLVETAVYNVSVMGQVTTPGVYALPRHQNDVAHAIAMAGGLTDFAADAVEVHRRMSQEELVQRVAATSIEGGFQQSIFISEASLDKGGGITQPDDGKLVVLRIPLTCEAPSLIVENQHLPQDRVLVEDVSLKSGDVVVIPRQPDEVFFVVGPLNPTSTVNFRVSELDRRLGNAFLLPKDRDIDVVTAVAMAGYIDPIDSPSTVTVHRTLPGETPLLVHVDLIAARYNWNENIYVQPGDIIYLNPDASWWCRRLFDRIVPDLITIPYRSAMERWIDPFGRRNN